MKNIILDIETGSAPAETVLAFLPEIERGRPDTRLKDPEKIAANLAKIEADYEAAKKSAIDRAALNAETGVILAIGWAHFPGQANYFLNEAGDEQGELTMLHQFQGWLMGLNLRDGYTKIFGHNLKGFDIPFLMRRMMKAGIMSHHFREAFFDKKSPRGYHAPWIIDTMEQWALGEYQKKISLNNLAKFFGLEQKTGTGDQFAGWFLGGEKQRALDYLAQDLYLCGSCAKKMGILDAAEDIY